MFGMINPIRAMGCKLAIQNIFYIQFCFSYTTCSMLNLMVRQLPSTFILKCSFELLQVVSVSYQLAVFLYPAIVFAKVIYSQDILSLQFIDRRLDIFFASISYFSETFNKLSFFIFV